MIFINGDVIKSYLVSLGFSVNDKEYQKVNTVLQSTARNVQDATKKISGHFLQAAAEIIGALGSVTAGTVAMVNSVIMADQKYQNMALTMHMSVEATREMDMALKAMGTTIEGVAWNPEQRQQYFELLRQQQMMSVGTGGESAFKDARKIRFEFVRMKLEAQYAIMWISYMLIEKLGGPLGSVKDKLANFNDYVSTHMPQIADKISNWLIRVINLFKTVIHYIIATKAELETFGNSLSKKQKQTIELGAAIATFFSIGSLGKARVLIAGLIFVLDDLYAYMDGRKSSQELSPIWDEAFKHMNDFKTVIADIKGIFMELVDVAKEFIKELIRSGALMEVLKMFRDIGIAVIHLGQGIWHCVNATEKLFGVKPHGFLEFIAEAVQEFSVLGQIIAGVADTAGLFLSGHPVEAAARWSQVASLYREQQKHVRGYNNGTSGGSGTGNEKIAMDFFTGLGYSKEFAAGMVGNLLTEDSTLDPTAEEVGGGGGYGIVQWTGGRRDALHQFADSFNLDPDDLQTQLKFIEQELHTTESGALASINASGASTPEEFARAISKYYERPENPDNPQRPENARSAFDANFQSYHGGMANISNLLATGQQNFSGMTNNGMLTPLNGSDNGGGDTNITIGSITITESKDGKASYSNVLQAVRDAKQKSTSRLIKSMQIPVV